MLGGEGGGSLFDPVLPSPHALPPMLLGAVEEGDHRMAACGTVAAEEEEGHRVKAKCTLVVAAVVLLSYLLKLLGLLVLYWTSMYYCDVLKAQIAWKNLQLKNSLTAEKRWVTVGVDFRFLVREYAMGAEKSKDN